MTTKDSLASPPRRRLVRDLCLGAGLALTFAALVVFLLPARRDDASGPTTDSAGRLSYEIAKASEEAHRMAPHLTPTDTIRFRYRGDGAGYLTILGADGDGRVQVYYPDGNQAAAWSPQAPALPEAVSLRVPLPTAFAAVLCPEPLPVETVREAMQESASPAQRFTLMACDIDTIGVGSQ